MLAIDFSPKIIQSYGYFNLRGSGLCTTECCMVFHFSGKNTKGAYMYQVEWVLGAYQNNLVHVKHEELNKAN